MFKWNYSIYIIKCRSTRKVYIGSTTRELKTRLSAHKCDYKAVLKGKGKLKKCTSHEVLEYNDYEIELLEYLDDVVPLVAFEKEYDYIQKYKNDNKYKCVNKQSPLTKDQLILLNKVPF